MRLFGGQWLVLTLVACSGHATPRASSAGPLASKGPARACVPLAPAARQAEEGSLRRAAAMLERETFCEAEAAEALRAKVLVELGRTNDAAPLVAKISPHQPAEAEKLRAEIERRTRPRSAAELRRASDKMREAITGAAEARAKRLLEAWELDPPNGLALVEAGELEMAHAAMGAREEDTPERRAQHQRGARLVERGVAELEAETGLAAHAGIAAPPVCVGHFSNYLSATWLDDSIHAVVQCTDAGMVLRLGAAGGPERVAQFDAGYRLDVARLPRLKFLTPASADASDASDTVSIRMGAATWNASTDREHSNRIVLTRSEATSGGPSWTAAVDVKPGYAVFPRQLVLTKDERWLFVLCEGHQGPFYPAPIYALDAATGRVALREAGVGVRLLDDGSIAIRNDTGVDLYDRALRRFKRIPGERGDLSPDAKRLVFTKQKQQDEMYHPYFPWFRELTRATDEDLGWLLAEGTLAPAAVDWPHVSVAIHSCAGLGNMPAPDTRCVRPSVEIGGRLYRSSDELACSVVGRGPVRDGKAQTASCLDPRGPVRATDPSDAALVCRVGPHVLPLRACAHLLAE